MTNEDAIQYFKHRLATQCGENTTQRKAFEKALEALKKINRSCENCAYLNGCKIGNLLIDEDLRTNDICCEEWYSKDDD